MNKYKLDNFWIGFIGGIVLPPITAFILLQITFASKFDFDISSQMYGHIQDYIAEVFKLGCLSNLLLFLPGFYYKMNNLSKGVIASTFLCFFGVLIYSFL